mmetsp:Transcript_23021/g.51926  ORF Transcript_23021/g.51926 Transcript_23021/m.51926 type:complete len:234 (-) Transcript_23021:552-1253(-)
MPVCATRWLQVRVHSPGTHLVEGQAAEEESFGGPEERRLVFARGEGEGEHGQARVDQVGQQQTSFEEVAYFVWELGEWVSRVLDEGAEQGGKEKDRVASLQVLGLDHKEFPAGLSEERRGGVELFDEGSLLVVGRGIQLEQLTKLAQVATLDALAFCLFVLVLIAFLVGLPVHREGPRGSRAIALLLRRTLCLTTSSVALEVGHVGEFEEGVVFGRVRRAARGLRRQHKPEVH